MPVSLQNDSTTTMIHYVGDSTTLNGFQFVSNFTNNISVFWTKNGAAVLNSPTNFSSVWNGQFFIITVSDLKIRSLDFADSGNYSCHLRYHENGILRTTVHSSFISLLVQSKLFYLSACFVLDEPITNCFYFL